MHQAFIRARLVNSLLKPFLLGTLLLGTLVLGVSPAGAETLITTTADRPVNAGILNQGVWTNRSDLPDENFRGGYYVGGIPLDGHESRSYFTFDLSTLGPDDLVNSATLRIVQPDAGPIVEFDQTIAFFEVDTEPAVLHAELGDGAALFADLGSGVNYGEIFAPALFGGAVVTREFALNEAALAAIASDAGGYFSLGAALLTSNGPGMMFAAGSEEFSAPVELVLDVTRIPESGAGTMALLAIATAYLRKRGDQKTATCRTDRR